jgi:regulator of RNase E activity RraA
MGMDIKCMFPEMGVMIGYAVTATMDSQTEEASWDDTVWMDVLRRLEASPKPAVMVFQHASPRPTHTCFFGDCMANISKRLGAVGLVTNGGVRDLAGVRNIGFQYYAPGVVPSHGQDRVIESNIPVEISGVRIEPGDLLHADENGVVLIPGEIADRLAVAAAKVWDDEADEVGFCRGPHFSLAEKARRLGL